MKDAKWEEIGVCGVDSGLIWLGDPCYCITPDASEHPAPTWPEFYAQLPEGADTHQFKYKHGHAGLGVVVRNWYGDGEYPVLVQRNADGHIVKAMIDFSPEEET